MLLERTRFLFAGTVTYGPRVFHPKNELVLGLACAIGTWSYTG